MRWIFVETLKEEEDVCIDLFFDGAVWFEYDTLACLHLSGSTYLAVGATQSLPCHSHSIYAECLVEAGVRLMGNETNIWINKSYVCTFR